MAQHYITESAANKRKIASLLDGKTEAPVVKKPASDQIISRQTFPSLSIENSQNVSFVNCTFVLSSPKDNK